MKSPDPSGKISTFSFRKGVAWNDARGSRAWRAGESKAAPYVVERVEISTTTASLLALRPLRVNRHHGVRDQVLRHTRGVADGDGGGAQEGLPEAGTKVSPGQEPQRRGQVQRHLAGTAYLYILSLSRPCSRQFGTFFRPMRSSPIRRSARSTMSLARRASRKAAAAEGAASARPWTYSRCSSGEEEECLERGTR